MAVFASPIVTGAQILRAVPGAAERTLRASPVIAARSDVRVAFYGNDAKCAITRTECAPAKATKRNPNPLPTYAVSGIVTLPGVDPSARLPRSLALDFMTYALHELAHAVFTDRRATDDMLRALAAELSQAYPARSVTAGGLFHVWNCVEDARIESSMVRHGMARGYDDIGRHLVSKHWADGNPARVAACIAADAGDERPAFALLPVSVAYVGRQWLAADVRRDMRAELPACILPALDAACAALATLHAPGVRSMHDDASGDAQPRDVLPILRAVCVAMLTAQADATSDQQGDAGAGAGDGSGKGEQPAPQPKQGKAPSARPPSMPKTPKTPADDAGEGEPGEGSSEPGEPAADDSGEPGEGSGDGEGEPGDGEGDADGEGEGSGNERPEDGSPTTDANARAGSVQSGTSGKNQTGSKSDKTPGIDLTDDGLADAPKADSITTPDITPATLHQMGSDNNLSRFGDSKNSNRIEPADDATRDANMRDARNAVKNPGGIAYQLRRLLSKTDTSEYRRGLSHGRLRVAALPRALASGTGAFQRRLEFGADRVSVAVAVDTSGSMAACDHVNGISGPSRARSAGHVLAILFDALRGCTGSRSYAFGFGGSTQFDEFGRQIFTAERIKAWSDSYAHGMARAANVRSAPHGGTPIRPALAHAFAELKQQPEGRRILLCLTDADYGAGDIERDIVERAEREGITCIGVGIGQEAYRIGGIFARHSIHVSQPADLSEKMLRTLADAVLTESGGRVLHAGRAV